MKIQNYYIFSNCNFSNNSAAATRMIYYAKALAGSHHKVYLVSCCSTELSESQFTQIAPNVFLHDQKKLTHNFIQTFDFLRRMDSFTRAKGPNAIFLLYPLTFVFLEIFTVLYLKLFKKNAVFYELNEVRKHASATHKSLTISNLSYSIKKIAFKAIFTLTEPLLYFYDGLVCISTEIEKYGWQFNKKTLRVPILTDPEVSISNGTGDKYRNREVFNIGFSGSIIPSKENLIEFIHVLNKLRANGQKIRFNLCGSVKDDDLNLILSKEETKGTITYHGMLNKNELSNFLSQQDLLVIPRGYNLQNKYGFSTKLSDYLNHKKIILVTDISDNKLFIKDGVNGFIVPPDNSKAMFEKLNYIITNFDNLEKTIIPNAQDISITAFSYTNFRKPLRKFLVD